MSLNPIIIKDEGGLGVQVGDEKVYLSEELMKAMHTDYQVMSSRFRALDAENVSLREQLTKQKEKSLYKSIRYDVIASIIENEGGF